MWNSGTQAHCRRVSAWCAELARALALPASDCELLEQAAAGHHLPDVLSDDWARHRLLADLRVIERVDNSSQPAEIRELLAAFHNSSGPAAGRVAKLATLLEIGHDFDLFFEAEPLAGPPESAAPDSAIDVMLSYLQVASRSDLGRVIDRLPVVPRAAQEAVKLASDPSSGPKEFERAASGDQVLAATLIQSANSAYYGRSQPVRTIPHAISYLGLDITRRVLLAGALRASFATRRHQKLWNHSLDVAQAMEQLALKATPPIDPTEAFLAGLVHDIGCLAFAMMPPVFLERFYRLTSRGCPAVPVEICLSGICHGEVGAETLRQWRFPESLVEAVEWHHRPERSHSTLAALLYLGEFYTDSEEDLPSCVRLAAAARQVGMSTDVLNDTGGRKTCLEALRFVA